MKMYPISERLIKTDDFFSVPDVRGNQRLVSPPPIRLVVREINDSANTKTLWLQIHDHEKRLINYEDARKLGLALIREAARVRRMNELKCGPEDDADG